MALINKLEKGFKEYTSVHDEVDATYYLLETKTGEKILQIDTYGRPTREVPGKISQSIQFSPRALEQLKTILLS